MKGTRRLAPPRIAYLVLALVVLVDIGVGLGSVNPLWQEVGGSASGDGLSQTPSPKAAFEAKVAVGGDGRPVVAYTEYPDVNAVQGAIVVKRWTGTAWQTLSGAAGIAVGYEPQVRVAADGAIYVAWLTDVANGNTQVRLRVWTGGPSFTELGGSDSRGGISGVNVGIAAPFSLALDAGGRPLIAFPGVAQTGVANVPTVPAVVNGTTQVYVRRWTGSAWTFVGSDFTGGGASRAVSFRGALGTVVHDADTPSLTVDSTGAPVVAFTYYTTINGQAGGNSDIFVARWTGSTWAAVGSAVPAADTAAGRGGASGVSNSAGGSFNASLGSGPAGRLALAWEDDQPTGEIDVRVRVWSGAAWSELGGSATGSGFNQAGTMNLQPSIAIGGDGRPVVAWAAQPDFASPSQVFVRRWNGASAWDEIGFHSAQEGGISDAAIAALGPGLALTPAGGVGVPAVAWINIQDEGDGQVFLRQVFTGATVPLTVRVTGSGTVASDPIGVQCASGSCVTALPDGTAISLTPQAAPGWSFTGWSGDCTGTGPCTLDLTAPRKVSANFGTPRRMTLTVTTPAGTGGQGAVASINGPGGACTFGGGNPCTVNVVTGSQVVLQAAPAPGNHFLSWSGGPCHDRTSATCAFTVPATGNLSIHALFRGVTAVSVGKGGNGTGAVSYGSAIACGARCAASIFTGKVVTLTPSPAAGSTFTGWSGGVCSAILSDGACRFTASGLNKTVTATFALNPHGLTLTVATPAGTGGQGAVGSIDGPGGACTFGGGNPCTVNVLTGSQVVLQATPAPGNHFLNWSGGPCHGQTSATCAFTVPATGNLSIHALFRGVTAVSVGKGGNGTGTVSYGSAIACGARCAASIFTGKVVTLTPSPAAGSTFTGWSGGVCSAILSDGACRFTASGLSKTVTATFALNPSGAPISLRGVQ